MKQKIKFILLFVTVLVFSGNLFAQDTIVIEKARIIPKGQSFDVAPGTVLVLKPGAKIWVEGSLNFSGTANQPITVISENTNDPGAGIVINGQSYQQQINISYTNFYSLIQALRFDPFWARKSIKLNQIKISQSLYNESSFYISAPFKDHGFAPIQFSITGLDYFNNNASAFIEDYGNNAIQYKLSGLNFYENKLEKSDEAFGILNIEKSDDKLNQSNTIDKIAFHKNFIGDKEIGLSVSGNQDSIGVQSLYYSGSKLPIADAKTDPRLPYVKIESASSLKESLSDKCFVDNVIHTNGKVTVFSSSACSVSALLDSAENKIPYTVSRNKDSITLSYNSKNPPIKMWMNELFWVPVPVLPKIDTLASAPIKPIETKVEEEKRAHGFWADSSMLKDLDLFKPSFEIGMFTGVAGYVGDIKPKFGIPACYEFSNGINIQYHHNKHLSYQFIYNRADIASNDPTALFLAYSSLPFYLDDGNTISKMPSHRFNFRTKLMSFELGTTYYFNRYDKNDKSVKNLKGRWVSGIGLGLGLLKYDPYRYAFYTKYADQIQWISLREMGTEGQNFLPGKSRYGQYAINFNLHYELNFCYERWKFKTELRGVITSTNYLDDIGEGYTYGNNYAKWLETIPAWNNYTDQYGNTYVIGVPFPDTGKTINKRSYSPIPDGYIQFHFGLSYDIGNPVKPQSKLQKFINKYKK